MSFLPLAIVVLIFWGSVFFLAFRAQGASFLDFARGPRRPLPDDLGSWKATTRREGLLRQERRLLPSSDSDPSHLIVQVRWLNEESGEVVHVEPERRERRARGRE